MSIYYEKVKEKRIKNPKGQNQNKHIPAMEEQLSHKWDLTYINSHEWEQQNECRWEGGESWVVTA